MKKLLALITVLIFVTACKNDDDDVPANAEPQIIFTYKGGQLNNTTEAWIIIRAHDTGELLDAQQIQLDPLIFKSDKEIPNNKLSVSLLRVLSSGEIVTVVYSGVEVGTEWKESTGSQGVEEVTPGAEIGSYNLTIIDVPNIYAFALSDKFGDRSENITFDQDFLDGTLSGEVNIREGAYEHFISIDLGDGKPKYATVPAVADGVDVELSYSDFKDFDNNITITFPENKYALIYTLGFDDAPTTGGYITYLNFEWGYMNVLKKEVTIGFLDRFENNVLQVQLNNDFTFFSRGSAPTSIDYVGSDKFTITSRTLATYAVTTPQTYLYRMVEYGYDDTASGGKYVDVSYYDMTPDAKHNEPFTNDLIQKFSIQQEKVNYKETYFYVKGQTAAEYLDDVFNKVPERQTVEDAYVVVP